jgi:hypothetical protein
MSVTLMIDGMHVDDEEKEAIEKIQAAADQMRKQRDQEMLSQLETDDRGTAGHLLAADKSGRRARLVHRDSFFIAPTPK